MTLALRSGAALTHQRADPGRSNCTGQQGSQENCRSCDSSNHVEKLYLRFYEMRKPVPGFSSSNPPLDRGGPSWRFVETCLRTGIAASGIPNLVRFLHPNPEGKQRRSTIPFIYLCHARPSFSSEPTLGSSSNPVRPAPLST